MQVQNNKNLLNMEFSFFRGVANADETRTRNLYKLTCTRNLHVSHSDLQQDFFEQVSCTVVQFFCTK